MAIEELLTVVPPPLSPSHATEGSRWDVIERAVGTRLPADYRDFALRYGSGRFDDGTYVFWVINPLSPDYPATLAAELELWRIRCEPFQWEYPAEIFPVAPGLFPWGRDEDGGMMGWLVEGEDPDRWAVVAKNSDGAFERFDMSLTSFLAQSLTHRLRPRMWRPDYPQNPQLVAFQPDES